MNLNTQPLYLLQLQHSSFSPGEWRNAESTKCISYLHHHYPVLSAPSLTVCVLLMYQISSAQMFNHSWQVTFFSSNAIIGWISACYSNLWRTERLDLSEIFTASDRRPTYHNVIDNRQWSRNRICKGTCPQKGWAVVVWSVPQPRPDVCQPTTADF